MKSIRTGSNQPLLSRIAIVASFVVAMVFATTDASARQSVSVAPATGAVQSQIPLWNLSDRSVNVPIALQYYGNGVKAGMSEGNAGVGWNISGAGAIYREVRGLPDDYKGTGTDLRKGWLIGTTATQTQNFNESIDLNVSVCTDEADEYTFFSNLNYNTDTEPDLYSVNVPGLSFQFVFDYSKVPKPLPFQNVQITPTYHGTTNEITQFVVKNASGTSYTFAKGTTEKREARHVDASDHYFTSDHGFYKTPLTFTSSWVLTKIESLDGGVVNIQYGQPVSSISSDKVEIIKLYSGSPQVTTDYTLIRHVDVKPLLSFSTSKIQVNFITESARVAKIEVTDVLSTVNKKEFHFDYKYFKYAQETYATGERRAFLVKMTELTDCAPIPPYQFTYKGISSTPDLYATIPIPFKSYGDYVDYWGYYNGQANNKIPAIYYYSGQAGAERFRLSAIPGQSATTFYAGGNKNHDFNSASLGALEKLRLPSGGYYTVTWESNTFMDPVSNQAVAGNGVRVKSISLSPSFSVDASSLTTNYSYNDDGGQTSGKLIYRPVYAFFDVSTLVRTPHNLAPDGGILYSQFTESVAGKGKTVYTHDNPAMYPYTTYNSWTASKTWIARKSSGTCHPLGTMVSSEYIFPFPPNPDLHFKRGLTTRVRTFTESGTMDSENLMTYGDYGTEAVIKGLRYEIIGNYVHFSRYNNIASVTNLVNTAVNKLKDQTSATFLTETTQYSYSTGMLFPQTITTTGPDGSVLINKMQYVGDFTIASPAAGTPEEAMKNLKDNYALAWPVESTTYLTSVATGNALSSSLTLYQKNNLNKFVVRSSHVLKKSTNFSPAVITSNVLTTSPDYELVSSIVQFDADGNAVSVHDGKVAYSGTHFGYNRKYPVLNIANAQADEVTFSNFEGTASFQFTIPSGTTESTGKTGLKARAMTAAKTFSRSAVPNRSFSNTFYFSCWAKATANRTVTVKFINPSGGAVVAQKVFNYASAAGNPWKFLQGEIVATGLPATYNLEVATNGGMELDDMIVYPANASVSHQTLNPLIGVTSVSNGTGNSVTTAYDVLGRRRATIDQDDNVLEKWEYGYHEQPPASVKADFTRGSSTNYYVVGTSDTFTAGSTCNSATYQWSVNGVNAGTASTQQVTFSDFTTYLVTLATSDPATGASNVTSKTYYTVPGTLAATMAVTNNGVPVTGNSQLYKCAQDEGNFERDFNVSLTGTCGTSGQLEYEWVYVLLSNGIEVPFTGEGGSSFHFNIVDHPTVYNQSFIVRCKIKEICTSGGINGYEVIRSVAVDHTVTYVHQTQCL